MPDALPQEPVYSWTSDLPSNGLGGIAANADYVIVGGRDILDRSDKFHCLSTIDGSLVWQVEYAAEGRLDYGNSPRATPLIHDGVVYLQSAFGWLRCIDLETGAEFWKVNLVEKFGSKIQTWGVCWSPILVDGKLMVQPGGEKASMAALDPDTGEVLWETKGEPAAYCSPIVATFSGVKQLIAYDKTTLGGWDVESGKRLWTLKPQESNDFNVPTPIQIGQRLFVATENNGARLFAFDEKGLIKKKPVATFEDFSPDTHTPVVVGDRVFGIADALFALSAKDLKQVWISEDEAFAQYGSIVASKNRALATTLDGQLILIDISGGQYKELSRLNLSPNEQVEVHSHPAFVGKDMYIRVGKKLKKLQLGE